MNAGNPQTLSRDYYARTAADYDSMHLSAGDEHYRALEQIVALARRLGLRSLLDLGCGTGRGLLWLKSQLPAAFVAGTDFSPQMLAEARQKGVPAECLFLSDAGTLPLPAQTFDAVFELGLLHHVPHPEDVVREMCRVARLAVFLSDDNRFGHGPWVGRVAKLALHRLGLWPVVMAVRTRGRGYVISPGDGVSYSYSVYDSLPQLRSWADQILLAPTRSVARFPLLGAQHLFVAAWREPKETCR